MLSLMSFTPRYAIFYAIYPKLCYLLCHIPRSSAIFFLNVMLQYITLTPSYANSSYAMFSGQSRGRISGYCCTTYESCHSVTNLLNLRTKKLGIEVNKNTIPFWAQLTSKLKFHSTESVQKSRKK